MRLSLLLLTACGVQTIERGIEVDVTAELASDTPVRLSIAAVELRACPSSARHSATSPTRIGDPHVFAANEARALGHFEPPPASYCVLALIVQPADADADGIDASMVGYSLAIGDVRFGGATEIQIPIALAADRSSSHALHVIISAARWLTGVDPTKLAEAQAQVLENVRESGALRP